MSPFPDDTQQIHDLLYRNLEQVLTTLYPQWVRDGKKALLNPKQKNRRYSSSFQMHLEGQDRGSWNRWSEGIGGSPINLVAYALTGNHKGKDVYRDAYDWCREYFGLETRRQLTPDQRAARDAEHRRLQKAHQKRQAEERAKAAAKRERKALTSREIAASCLPITGTLADGYLQSRTLPPAAEWPSDLTDHLGFHPALEYDPLRQYQDKQLTAYGPDFPALVFFIRDPFGDIVALQRIFLSPDGRKLETIRPELDSKVTFGSPAGGACRIGGDGERIGLMEGPETALGLWFLHNCRFPMWSALSTSGLKNFQAPGFVTRIDIFQDGDRAGFNQRGDLMAPPGGSAALQAAANQRDAGIKTVLQDAPALGDGLNLWEIFKSYADA